MVTATSRRRGAGRPALRDRGRALAGHAGARAGGGRERVRHAVEGLGPPIKGPTALGNDPRRLLPADVGAGRHRLAPALLRLGAGLPVVLRAAADALRRPLHGVQRAAELQRRRALLPGRAAARHRHVLVPQRGDGRRRAQPGQPREPRAQDRVPAPGGPDGDGADGVLQPRPQPRAGDDLPHRLRRRSPLGRGSRCRSSSRSSSPGRPASRCSSRRSSCATATSSRSGPWCCRSIFYITPIFYTVLLVREKASESVVRLMMLNPFAAMLQQARYAFIDPSHPSLGAAMGGVAWIRCRSGHHRHLRRRIRRLLARGAARGRGALGPHAVARRAEGAHVGEQVGDQPRVDTRGAELLGLAPPAHAHGVPHRGVAAQGVAGCARGGRRSGIRGSRCRTPGRESGSAAR